MAKRERLEVYKCNVCGNIVEVLNGGSGTLTCCSQSMEKMDEKTADFATEKHVPVIEAIKEGVLVKVGSIEHPMTADHYIQWIEIINGDYIQRKYLKPGDKPEAMFYLPFSDKLQAREYCNLHGNWKN